MDVKSFMTLGPSFTTCTDCMGGKEQSSKDNSGDDISLKISTVKLISMMFAI
jgi:hypothetical protein